MLLPAQLCNLESLLVREGDPHRSEEKSFLKLAGRFRRTSRSSMHTILSRSCGAAALRSASTGTSGAIGEPSVIHVSFLVETRLTIVGTTTLRPLLSVRLTFLSNSNWSDSCRLTSVKRRFNEASMRSCGYAG